MLRQARVEDILKRRITRRHGYVVVVTHYYPRFLKSLLIDEYLKELAPSEDLLKEFKNKESEIGDSNKSFDEISYQTKFWLSDQGFGELARLAEMAKTTEVYLVCHCKVGDRCHREILMTIVKEIHQAPTSKIFNSWEVFRERLSVFRKKSDQDDGAV